MEHPDILNWRRVDARVTTSGQPSEAQLRALAEDGVAAIINLAPADNNGALPDEAEIIDSLGLGYSYIPVDFEAPTEADFDRFTAAMAEFGNARVHVHCIYNARVTAFMLRYARARHGDADAAKKEMETIWRPGTDWADFLSEPGRRGQANAYAGYDYTLTD